MARRKGQAQIDKRNQVLERLAIEYVPLDAVKPNEYNPNRQSEHDFELLVKSMREDGFTQPIICQRDGTIVDGEHRWRAAHAMGMEEIPVVFVDMTPEQMRIATLRHNRARGSEEIELTAQVLRDLRELGALDWAMDSLDLDDVEVQRLLDDIPCTEALAGEEYGEACEPERRDHGSSEEGTQIAQRNATMVIGRTGSAADVIREREAAVSSARTAEERATATRESGGYRLMLFFTDEEGIIVKGVLEPEPAAKLLALCRAESERLGLSNGATNEEADSDDG